MVKMKDPDGAVFEIADDGVDAMKALGWESAKTSKAAEKKED